MSDEPGPGWWWLSFVDLDRPEGHRFLGVTIIHASSAMAAVRVAHLQDCNPGGEVAIIPIHVDSDIPPEDRERLLSADEARALMRLVRGRDE